MLLLSYLVYKAEILNKIQCRFSLSLIMFLKDISKSFPISFDWLKRENLFTNPDQVQVCLREVRSLRHGQVRQFVQGYTETETRTEPSKHSVFCIGLS